MGRRRAARLPAAEWAGAGGADRRARGSVRYLPIDISPAALQQCCRTLETIRGVEIRPLEASYLDGLSEVVRRRHSGQAILLLFLGSTIGNFAKKEAQDFLRMIRLALQPGDALLLGADLVKPKQQMLDAYDDPIGATAAFNLNLLARINRELGSDFDPWGFTHLSLWNSDESRIEMHLVSRRAQKVHIPSNSAGPALILDFASGETIHTENSYKFTPARVRRLLASAGFELTRSWQDDQHLFAVNLATAI